MEGISRLYLDTNVFVAMGEGADDLSQALFDLVAAQVSGEKFLCTSELALAELLVHPYRDKNDAVVDMYDGWITSGGWLEAGPVDRSVLRYAAVVRQQYPTIKLPDAIHLSTSIGFACSHYLTGDKRLPRDFTLLHERWGLVRGPARIRILDLTVETVREILAGKAT